MTEKTPADKRTAWEDWNAGSQPRYPHSKVIQYSLRSFSGRPKGRALDWGCGAGINSWFLAREGFNVVGTDISENGIAAAQALFAKDRLSADFRVADLTDPPADRAPFDLVICIGVFEAVGPERAARALEALAPLLSTDARGLFVFMAEGDFRERSAASDLLRAWSEDEVREVFSLLDGAHVGEYKTDYGTDLGVQRDWLVSF